MNVETTREYCLSLPHVTEDTPFGEDTLVFRLKGKIFALMGIEQASTINLKCEPERAVSLREHYPERILPGYHMNKTHWNTVVYTRLPDALVQELIRHSYERIKSSLPKKERDAPVDGE